MKTLILDEKKWRCGGDVGNETNIRGTGLTALLNRDGFMCCLGQFSRQLNPKIKKYDLMDVSVPESLEVEIPLLVKKKGDYYSGSSLVTRAININDSGKTTISQKVKSLTKLFATKGYRIVFKKAKKKK